MSFLRHDMSSVDPSTAYEPSRGDPTRIKRTAFGVGSADGQYVLVDGQTTNKAPVDARRQRIIENAAVSTVGSSSFYAGNHSYDPHKSGVVVRRGSLRQGLFADPTKETRRAVNKAYAEANQRRVAEKQRLIDEHKRIEHEAQHSLVTTDPWKDSGKPPVVNPSERRPRVKVDFEAINSDNSSYAARYFGKAPVKKDENGNLQTRRVNQVAKYQHHQQSGEDSYAAKVFGKDGFGAPKRTQSGQVLARRPGKLQNYAIHNESSTNDTYVDKAFGKPPVTRTASGTINARRKNVLEKDKHHQDTAKPAYNDLVFENKHPSASKTRRRGLERVLEAEEKQSRHDFLDNLPKKKPNARPRRLSHDPEFCFRQPNNKVSTSFHKN